MKYILFISLILSAITLSSQEYQASPAAQLDSLFSKCGYLINENKLDSAEVLNSQANIICLRYFNDKHYYYGLVQFIFARIKQIRKDISGAEPLFLQTKEIFEKTDSISSRYYLQCLYLLVRIYTSTNREELAEQYLISGKEIALKYYGPHHLEYAKCLLRFSSLYWALGRYNQDTFMEKAHEIYIKNYGGENLETSKIKFDIGQLYVLQNDYKKAEKIFLEIKQLREKFVGKKDLLYINVLMALAETKKGLGNYIEAEAGYKEVELLCAEYGYLKSGIFKRLNALLGTLYYEHQDFRKAEHYFIRSSELERQANGAGSKEFASSLNNLGNVYNSLGNYKLAEKFYLQSMDILIRLFGPQSPHVISKMINLGSLYGNMKDHKKSLDYLKEAMLRLENNKNMESRDYARALINLASTYAHLNNDILFEQSGRTALDLIRKLVGKENQDYVSCLIILAEVEIKRSNYFLADSIYQEAQRITVEVMGKGNPTYWMISYLMARLNIIQGDFAASEKYLMERSFHGNLVLKNSIKYLSEDEMKHYINQFYDQQDGPLTYCKINEEHSDSLLSICYMNSIYYKEFLLSSDNQFRIQSTRDSNLLTMRRELLDLRSKLAIQYTKPEKQQIGVAKMEESLKEIQKQVGGLLEIKDPQSISLWNLKKRLQPGEIAIEFVKFNIVDFKKLYGDITDTIYYAALLLSPGIKRTIFIPLFNESELRALLLSSGSEDERQDELFVTHSRGVKSGELIDQKEEFGPAMYKLLWRPLVKFLNGVKVIYYSPIGLLQKVSFNAIPVSSKQTLGNLYNLYQMGSTKNLVEKASVILSKDYQFCIFGGVNYNVSLTSNGDSLSTMNDEQPSWTYFGGKRNVEFEDGFQFLEGAATEAMKIMDLLHKNKIRSTLFYGKEASEENFKKIGMGSVQSPEVLHIATHGFYFSNPGKWDTSGVANFNTFKWNNNPLLRSGIILAGANEAWTSGKCPANREDGVVTSYEISQLNLSNTKLVVLSACETALGDIESTEGVYGLQRAFKMAGVKHMLLSLWKVPDKETSEFMDTFYKTWLREGKDIHKAFKTAQKKMQKKYNEVSKWGAWVLIE